MQLQIAEILKYHTVSNPNMVTFVHEAGLHQEIKILLERHMPFYEKAICTTKSCLFDKLHIGITNKTIGKIISLSSFPLENDGTFPLFRDIEIELINRCNGECSFCPVNRQLDPREFALMPEDLFFNIINQLKELDYNKTICFNGNNEPLLDKRLEQFLKYTKETVPKACIIIFTNGTLLSVTRFDEIMKYVDELFIDNYNDNRQINKPVQQILDHIKFNQAVSDKITVIVTRKDALRTTRAGTASNRGNLYFMRSPCVYPFWQMNVRPTGEISLCCNDALGKFTLGDLTKQTLVEAWNSKEYTDLRNTIVNGRHNIDTCKNCDVFIFNPFWK
jgi:radical SAM protein with 4Fe4S-binding SPASM domain